MYIEVFEEEKENFQPNKWQTQLKWNESNRESNRLKCFSIQMAIESFYGQLFGTPCILCVCMHFIRSGKWKEEKQTNDKNRFTQTTTTRNEGGGIGKRLLIERNSEREKEKLWHMR